MKTPTSVKKILTRNNSSSGLQQLTSRVNSLRSLNTRLQQLLPSPLAQHCSVATIEQHKLVILVSSAAWATRLRLLHPKIIKAFSDTGIKSVSTRIVPEAPAYAASATPRRQGPKRISRQSAKLLTDLADATSDPKLKSALKRLSKHGLKQT